MTPTILWISTHATVDTHAGDAARIRGQRFERDAYIESTWMMLNGDHPSLRRSPGNRDSAMAEAPENQAR